MAPSEIQAEVVQEHLQRVLDSPGFARNERMSHFLRFIVERQLDGRESELKESLIGIEVFGRKPGFDPKRDSTVRTEAARLRARLTEYYASEGRGDTLVLELPKGGYTPRFRQPEAAPPQPRPRVRRMAALAGIAASLAAAGWWWIQHTSAPIPIAVLPLIDLSEDSGSNYLADGLTSEIIRNLSTLDGLTVRSQTSSFVFKGKPRNLRAAGKELEADYILEGSVVRAGRQLRINAQFIRVRDDIPVWSGRYDRELADVLAIQDEISRGIVNSLRLKLGRGRRRYETNTEAYDLYLRARAQATRLFPGSDEVIGLFEKAIAKDPSLAPAQAGLAEAYASQSSAVPNDRNREDKLAKMRAAAETAIQLDPLLAEAHSALGTALVRDGHWEQAERSFRRAIEIDPNLPAAHGNFGMFLLLPLGRIEEAVREGRTQVRVDPLSPIAHYELARALLSAGRFDEALGQCEKLPGDYLFTSECLGRARLGQGRTAEAIQVLGNANNWGYLAYAYGRAGRRAEAEKLMTEAPKLHPQQHGAFQYAFAFAGLGDKDRTIEQLERMAGTGAVRIGYTLIAPELAFVRDDTRVKALKKRVGLPE